MVSSSYRCSTTEAPPLSSSLSPSLFSGESPSATFFPLLFTVGILKIHALRSYGRKGSHPVLARCCLAFLPFRAPLPFLPYSLLVFIFVEGDGELDRFSLWVPSSSFFFSLAWLHATFSSPRYKRTAALPFGSGKTAGLFRCQTHLDYSRSTPLLHSFHFCS